MIYSIGTTSTYAPTFQKMQETGGQMSKSVGGIVFKTKEDAQGFMKDWGLRDKYCVAEIDGDWEAHTEPSPIRYLTAARPIVKLDTIV